MVGKFFLRSFSILLVVFLTLTVKSLVELSVDSGRRGETLVFLSNISLVARELSGELSESISSQDRMNKYMADLSSIVSYKEISKSHWVFFLKEVDEFLFVRIDYSESGEAHFLCRTSLANKYSPCPEKPDRFVLNGLNRVVMQSQL